jgi:hypothetical protein
MYPVIDEKYLITTDNWFVAPDGEQYKAIFGTVSAVLNDEETLGVKTNRGSSNWFVTIGNMIVAGCQIHYCIQTDEVNHAAVDQEFQHEGELIVQRENKSRIYIAD